MPAHLEPEHVGGAWLFWELAKLVPAAVRKFLKKKEPARLPPGRIAEAVAQGELRGEFHEFKRAVLAELEVQRSRYHGLRAIVTTNTAINGERRAARERGEQFDTGVYEANLQQMLDKLDAIPDVELPSLSPPSQRPIPPLGSPVPKPGDDTE